MFQYLSIITTITGMFTLLDLFVEKRAKAKVAEYVFGFGTANLAGFEHSVITGLLSLYKVDGRLSLRRVLFRYSGMISLLIAIMSVIGTYIWRVDFLREDLTSPFQYILQTIILIPMAALVFWPFDCWSLWVTNKIFKSNVSPSLISFAGRILLDIIVTILPLIILLFGVFVVMGVFKTYIVDIEAIQGVSDINSANAVFTILVLVVFTTILLNIAGSLLITAVQLFTLGIGVSIRLTLRVTRLNQHLAMVSSAPDFPFTFIGLLCGISATVVTMILT